MFGSRFMSLGLVGLIAFGTPTLAQSASSLRLPSDPKPAVEKWKAEYQLFLGVNSFDEGKDEGFGSLLYFKTKFGYQFMPWLRVAIKPRLDLFAGRAQERFDNDTYQNRIRLLEGYIAFQPTEFFEVRTGDINQGYLDSPMLISSHRGFPGFQELLTYQSGTLKAELIAEQVVPTSYSLNVERQTKEQMPSFLAQSFHLSGKSDWAELKMVGGHFQWANMPDKIAAESMITGNLTNGVNGPGARFKNKFDGWFGGVEFCACISGPVQFTFDYQRIMNAAAPSAEADAQSWGLGPRFIWGDREFEIRYRNYFIESDATIGTYNRSLLGNTNRMGDDIEFKLDFKDRKFAIVGEWINARTIRDNPTQKTMTVYYIGLETPYAPF